MNNDNLNLSDQGNARRDEILRDALAAGQTRRARRQLAMSLPIVAGLVLVGLIVWSHTRASPRQEIAQQPPPTTQIDPSPMVKAQERKKSYVTLIVNNPDALRRYTQPPGKEYVTIASDDQLIAQMAAAGHPVGLAYVGGQVHLLPR